MCSTRIFSHFIQNAGERQAPPTVRQGSAGYTRPPFVAPASVASPVPALGPRSGDPRWKRRAAPLETRLRQRGGFAIAVAVDRGRAHVVVVTVEVGVAALWPCAPVWVRKPLSDKTL